MTNFQQQIEELSTAGKSSLARLIREHIMAERQGSALDASDDRLVAYVIPEDTQSFSADDVSDYAANRLPDYMVPWAFVDLPSVPRMPNGKVDHSALPDPTHAKDLQGGGQYVEPRTKLEEQIALIWAEQLKLECVGVRDDFFEIGGNSLVAIQLFAKINDACGTKIRLSALLENPTVEQIAALVEIERKERSDANTAEQELGPPLVHIVEMNVGGSDTETPLFLVSGMRGVVDNLQSLADRIGSQRRIYGFQAGGLAGESEPHQTFAEMADAYVEEVVRVQPTGPYLLGGYCSGGFVALEVATRLRARGEQIEQIVMLDTYSFPDMKITTLDKLKIHYQRLRRRGVRYVLEWARDRLEWEVSRLRRWMRGPTTDPAQRVAEAFYAATANYELQPYDGRVALFRPKIMADYVLGPGRIVDEDRLFLFEDNNLRSSIPDLTVYEIPGGDHDTFVLPPNVGVLVEKLNQRLERPETAPLAPAQRTDERDVAATTLDMAPRSGS